MSDAEIKTMVQAEMNEEGPVDADVRAELLAADVVRNVAELGDRSSPDHAPDHLLVTEGELFDIVADAVRPLLMLQVAASRARREELEWIRKEIVGLCEATEYHPTLNGAAEKDKEGKIGAFARGRIHEAKGIRSALSEVIRARLLSVL